MTVICGADGCRAGWVAVSQVLDTGELSWATFPTVDALAQANPVRSLIALDIPIGLPDRGARECDLAARRLLGPGRASSVFPAPIRPLLAAATHAEACSLREAVEGKRLPIQAWAILPKICEVDATLRRDLGIRARVREVHPEVCFYYLAGGQPMRHGKKSAEGRDERLVLLRQVFGASVDAALADRRRLGCAVDDLLDAFAALWSARRARAGEATVLPPHAETDRYGLPMEMVA